MKFRKKPVVIDAVQWDEDARTLDTLPGLRSIVLSHEGSIYLPCLCQNLRIKTPEGDLHVSRGDWIIRGVKGEYYPCKPDIFAATYEPTDAPDESARLREEVERLTNALASARAAAAADVVMYATDAPAVTRRSRGVAAFAEFAALVRRHYPMPPQGTRTGRRA